MRENLTTEGAYFLAKWLDGTISDTKLRTLVSEKDFIDYKKLKNGLDLLDQLDRPVTPSFNSVKSSINQKINWG